MKRSMAVAAMLFMMPVAAGAQDAIPALKGTWRGTGKILLFGTTEHLSGSPQNAVVRDLEVTHTVTGQDGRFVWGTTSSANNDSKEPFAWRCPRTTRPSRAPIPTAITESHSCRPTGSRNVTSKTPRGRGTPLLQPAS
jgi:hypothetical protein